MSASRLYALAMTLLGAWGVYATWKSVKPEPGWSWRRRLAVFVDSLFVSSCLGCAAALWTEEFRAWMAAPLGVSYLLLIPFPCYFDSVNRVRWIHTLRDALFVAVALALLALAAKLVPLSALGL